MAQESFYGGRQGASFVIVKQYASIAAMLTEFGQGGGSIGQVNYGEYVIIDTPNKNDPENGCVYRRDMNYNAEGTDPIKDPGKGAFYVGQICGPDGKIRDIKISSYNDEDFYDDEQELLPDVKQKSYTLSELVPGKYNDGELVKYNDNIDFRYLNIKDSDGNIQQYLIGFRFPYLVLDIDGILTNPYDKENLITRIDDETHPYFEEQNIRIPQGTKGDSNTNIGIYPIYVRQDSEVYTSIDRDTETPIGTSQIISGIGDIVVENYRPQYTYLELEYNGNTYYTNKENCYGEHLGYLETNYDEETPVSEQKDIGDYRNIKNIELESSTGKLTVHYTSGDDTIIYMRVLIGAYIETDGNQKIHLRQKENGNDVISEIGDPINYVQDAAVSNTVVTDESHLLLYQADPARREALIEEGKAVSYDDKDGWLDLGNIKGAKGGISILGRVDSVNDLYDSNHNAIPPEQFKTGCEGWCMAVGIDSPDVTKVIYGYSYNTNPGDWFPLGDLVEGSLNANIFFSVVNNNSEAPANLKENGILFIKESRKVAE